MSQTRFETWHFDLEDLLGLAVPPVAIAFSGSAPTGIGRLERAMPAPTVDGRTGAVAASCVFWTKGTRGILASKGEDHGNCSVRSVTHGFKIVNEIARNSDVPALCETGWVTPEALGRIAALRERPANVIYGPLRDMPVEPAVILLRLNGKQKMLLHDALPALRFEGKTELHNGLIAKET